MLERPTSFSEIYGQRGVLNYFSARIESHTLPSFIVLQGEAGLGKTTVARIAAVKLACPNRGKHNPGELCPYCEKNTEEVIINNHSTQNIKLFKMSVEGGKAAVVELLQYCNTEFLEQGARVIIADEVQNMSKAAYDALLEDTEYLPEDVYLFMCTTDPKSIPDTLYSRASHINFRRLSREDINALLVAYAGKHGLDIEYPEIAYDLISSYAENKPRAALMVLNSMGTNRKVALSEIKDYVNFQEPSDIIPLIHSLSGELLDGIDACVSLDFSVVTQQAFTEFLSSCLKFKMGGRVFKYSSANLREATLTVSADLLAAFLYEISNLQSFTASSVLSAFLRVHPKFSHLRNYDSTAVGREATERLQNQAKQPIPNSNPIFTRAPQITDLLRNGVVLEKGGS